MAWSGAGAGSVLTHLHDVLKTCLLKTVVDPYATVCDLYCGCGIDTEKWAEAQIGQYFGIDLSASALNEAREQWEYHRRPYPADFYELDPCMPNLASHLQDKGIPTDIVCCLRNLQDCFASENHARSLLQNVASLLKPGGYFFGITADSSTIWSKYQKAVEGAMKAGSLRVNGMLPRVRTEHYVITFEDDRFTPFGMKYQLQFSDGLPSQSHLLVHFPSLIRLATEVGLEYVEIQNMLDFYEDHRSELAGMLHSTFGSLLDNKGRLSHRTPDVLSLFTTFIFQKPDHYVVESMSSPSFTYDRAHTESSNPMIDPCSESMVGQIHDTQSLLDSRDQNHSRHCHFSEMTPNEVLMSNNSYSHVSNQRSTYDGNFHGNVDIWQKNCDDANKLVGCTFSEKTGSIEEELLDHADISPQREVCNSTQNGKGKQNSCLTHTHVRFDLSESHDDHSGNVSPEKSLGLDNNHEKKSAEVKFYSRSNGNHRKYLDGKLPVSFSTSQEPETACQYINGEKSQQGNDLQHLKSEKKITVEKRPSSISRDKRDAVMGSHPTLNYDRSSSYDEGEHSSFNEWHQTSRSRCKDGANQTYNAYLAKVGDKNVDQQHMTDEEVEHCNVDSKKQNLPSILGPGPTELRFGQTIDIREDINDYRQKIVVWNDKT